MRPFALALPLSLLFLACNTPTGPASPQKPAPDPTAAFAHRVTLSQEEVCRLDTSTAPWIYFKPDTIPDSWRATIYAYGGQSDDAALGYVAGHGFQLYLPAWACRPRSRHLTQGNALSMADSSVSIFWN